MAVQAVAMLIILKQNCRPIVNEVLLGRIAQHAAGIVPAMGFQALNYGFLKSHFAIEYHRLPLNLSGNLARLILPKTLIAIARIDSLHEYFAIRGAIGKGASQEMLYLNIPNGAALHGEKIIVFVYETPVDYFAQLLAKYDI